MAKKTKVVVKSTIAAALAATAVIPVIAAPASAAAASVTEVVYVTDGKNVSLSFDTFTDALNADVLTNLDIKYIKAADGNYYTFEAFTDALNATETLEEALQTLADNAEELAQELTDVVEGTVGEDGNVTAPAPAPELTVESVSAINLTTVKVTFDKAVDTVAKENFKIEGSAVKTVSLSEDKKTATLTVDKLNYGTEYTVVATNVEVDGEVQPDSSKTFTTPAVTDLWDLKINAPEKITADGVDTVVVKFELLDENGEVDTDANDIVLDLNSTYGYLSQKRVTIQNGVAQVILRSEFVADGAKAKIDAQIIEAKAGSEYKDLIGKVFGTETIDFVPAGSNQEGSIVKLISLVGANTNEADRVVLTFDEEVSPSDFYTVSDAGVVTNKPGVVTVSQNSNLSSPATIKGYLFDENKKKVTVVLDKSTILEDNKDVYVNAKIGQASAVTKSFKLADARTPNFTGVTVVSNKELTVTFSEPISDADFKIDARFIANDGVNPNDFDVTFGDLVFEEGRYVDYRNQATIELTNYHERDEDENGDRIYPVGFFKPGKHSIEAANIFDFAADSDTNNIGTTQNLEFTIKEDNTAVVVTPVVDSPEQYRVNFDKDVRFVDGNTPKAFHEVVQFQVWDAEATNAAGTKGDWVAVDGNYFSNDLSGVTFGVSNDASKFLKVTALPRNSYKLETTVDWTKIYDTAATKDNYYNDQFRLVLPKNSVVTAINGKKNAEDIVLPLTTIDGKGTALATPDTKSPEILDIERIGTTNQFVVTMTEPVKLLNNTDGAGTTLAQNQTALPETKVEFLGKDKDGKVRTYTGTVVRHFDEINNKIIVEWDTPGTGDFPTPQDLVDQEDNTNTTWTVVVKSISDDIGNTVPTATREFTLAKSPTTTTPAGVFKVVPTGGNAIGADGTANTFQVKGEEGTVTDTITLTFTEDVAVVGTGSATNVMNYTLNGDKLPTGSTIALGADDKTVVISVKAGTLRPSNVITLAKHIESKDAKVITGDVTFTFAKITLAQQTLADATDAVEAAELSEEQADVDAAQLLVTALPAGADKDALQDRLDAVQDAIDAAANAAQALADATDAVEAAELSEEQADVDAAQLLVTALPAGADKDALQDRLDAITVAP